VAPDANASLHLLMISARCRALLCGLLAAAMLAGCGGAKLGAPTASSTSRGAGAPGSGRQAPAKTTADAGSTPSRTGAGTPHEIADPEEANSFPAPADVRHSAAKAPVKAAEAIVAAGAPSDAEVRAELAQMQAAEKSASRARGKRLVPVPGGESIGGDGQLPIPPGVPEVVQKVIAGANEIADFPYVFGGGHASFIDNAYDCSGSVSYALAAGGLLSSPETSGELEKWGAPGPGRYITVLANAGHTYMYVDGILFDTAGRSGVYASRWQVTGTDNSGYVVRHWPGL
jgi:cell wall-associated NlpC family hydrolase